VICHSQGAILLRNALMTYPKELRKRIIVVAIAPGAYINQKHCASVMHYTTKWNRDIVPWLDTSSFRRKQRSVTSLEPHKDADYFDHSFQSLTYAEAIRNEIKNYKKKYTD